MFFFSDTATTEIYTLSLHDALPLSYWNRACVEFAGREPRLGEDRWCVTWKIYTTSGDPLPHHKCPMAQAIRERREIRGAVAIRSEEHTPELQSRQYLVCRLLLEKHK